MDKIVLNKGLCSPIKHKQNESPQLIRMHGTEMHSKTSVTSKRKRLWLGEETIKIKMKTDIKAQK